MRCRKRKYTWKFLQTKKKHLNNKILGKNFSRTLRNLVHFKAFKHSDDKTKPISLYPGPNNRFVVLIFQIEKFTISLVYAIFSALYWQMCLRVAFQTCQSFYIIIWRQQLHISWKISYVYFSKMLIKLFNIPNQQQCPFIYVMMRFDFSLRLI